MPRKKTPLQRLVDACDAHARAVGEAEYMSGYRVGIKDVDGKMFQAHSARWERAARAERAFRRLAAKLLREARKGA